MLLCAIFLPLFAIISTRDLDLGIFNSGFGLLPLFILLGILTQAAYWASNGGYTKWRDRNKKIDEVEKLTI